MALVPAGAKVVLSASIVDAAEGGDVAAVEGLLDSEGYASPDTRNLNQSTLLHAACRHGHLPLAAALIARGANVNALDYGSMRRTPLHWVSCVRGKASSACSTRAAHALCGGAQRVAVLAAVHARWPTASTSAACS